MEEMKIKGFKITIDKNGILIKDSYSLTNINKMRDILKEILSKTIEYNTNRSLNSLVNEWIAHNVLYKFHLFRKHTRDTYFEKRIKKIISFLYILISLPSKIKYGYIKLYLSKKIKRKNKQYKKQLIKHQKYIKKAYKELISFPDIFLIIDKEILDKLQERVLIHDQSKFEPEEFDAYRKNFYPINKQEKEENIENFKKALEHHYKNNRHHWQNRQYKQTFNICDDDEIVDVLENIIDWLAVGYQYKNRPYEYYEQNKDKIILCDRERAFLEHILYDILESKENKQWRKKKKKNAKL